MNTGVFLFFFFCTCTGVHVYKHIFQDRLIHGKAWAFLYLLPMCTFHRNALYSCARVIRAHTLCPWGVDLSLGSGWLWSEWRALIFKHMLLRERDGKWFMIYTVVSQLKRSTLCKDSRFLPAYVPFCPPVPIECGFYFAFSFQGQCLFRDYFILFLPSFHHTFSLPPCWTKSSLLV